MGVVARGSEVCSRKDAKALRELGSRGGAEGAEWLGSSVIPANSRHPRESVAHLLDVPQTSPASHDAP